MWKMENTKETKQIKNKNKNKKPKKQEIFKKYMTARKKLHEKQINKIR